MASPKLQTRVEPEVADRVEQYQDDAEDPITKAEAVRRLVHDGLEANGYTDDHAADGGDESLLDRLGPSPVGDITTPFELFTSKVYGAATVTVAVWTVYTVLFYGSIFALGGPTSFVETVTPTLALTSLLLWTVLLVLAGVAGGFAGLCELALATNLGEDRLPDTLTWGPRGGNR